MTTACVVGSTGLVGSQILATLKSLSSVSTIHAYSRRELAASDKVQSILSEKSDSWPSLYPTGVSIFLSGLGTTRAKAGGLDRQWKLDHDLNLDLAKAAKEKGTKVYVLISSAGANPGSRIPYPKMKGKLEEAVKALDFEHTIILRPGLLIGIREDSRPPEYAFRAVANFMGSISDKLKDFWAQDGETVARAAVSAGLAALDGKDDRKVWEMTQADIVRLGRTEWKDAA